MRPTEREIFLKEEEKEHKERKKIGSLGWSDLSQKIKFEML